MHQKYFMKLAVLVAKAMVIVSKTLEVEARPPLALPFFSFSK
jgi:hypothetical protein